MSSMAVPPFCFANVLLRASLCTSADSLTPVESDPLSKLAPSAESFSRPLETMFRKSAYLTQNGGDEPNYNISENLCLFRRDLDHKL